MRVFKTGSVRYLWIPVLNALKLPSGLWHTQKTSIKYPALSIQYRRRSLLGLLAIALIPYTLYFIPDAQATTGINSQINFQARLFTAAGAVIPDGNYNIEFKIYQDGTGCVSTGSSPCGGTLKWTEDWLNNNSQSVVVRNGYFSVQLGSITSLSTVDFNQSVNWLSLNLGNTNATCTPFSSCSGDGEMLPFQRLGSAAYSFNSDRLGGLQSSAFGQLSANQTWTGTNTLQPTTDITGLIVKQTSVGSPTADILKVQNASNNEVLSVTAAGAVTLGKASTVNGAVVFKNSSNANTIVLQSGVTAASGYTLTLPTALGSSGDCIKDTTGAGVLGFGACGAGTVTDLQTAYNGSTSPATILLADAKNFVINAADTATDPNILFNLQCVTSCSTGGRFAVQNGGTDVFTVSPNGGAIQFKNSSNSTTAFQVQNAAGTSIVNIDTATNKLTVTQGNLDVTGLAAPGAPTVSGSGSGGTLAAGTYYYRLAATNGAGRTNAVDSSPVSVTTFGSSSVVTINWSAVTNATGYFLYRSSDGGITWYRNTIASGATVSAVDNGTNFTWSGTNFATAAIQNQTSQIKLAQGGRLVLDTLNNAELLENAKDGFVYLSNFNSGKGVIINGDNFSVKDSLGNSTNLTISNTGANFKNSADSSNAFQIQKANGDVLFAADTSNNEIELGKAGASGIDGKLVLYDSANSNTVTLSVGATSSSYSLLLPTSAGSNGDCLKNSATPGALTFGSCGGSVTDLQTAYNGSSSPATILLADAKTFVINAADTATDPSILFNLQCVTSCSTNGRFAVQSGGTDVLTVSPNGGAVLLQNTADSTAAFKVNRITGSTTDVLTVDTTNSQTILRGINSSATLGSELFTSGSCSGTNWTGTGPWTHTSGSSAALSCTPPASVTAGASYVVRFTYSGNTAGAYIFPTLGGTGSETVYQDSAGTFTNVLVTSGTGNLTLSPDTTFNGTISAVSIKQISYSSPVLTVKNSSGTPSLEVRSGAASSANTLIGLSAGSSITTGINNTALGLEALQFNTIGSANTAIGDSALWQNTTGGDNTAIGIYALNRNTDGSSNVAIGSSALVSNNTGNQNVAIGVSALENSVNGSNNIALGGSALQFLTFGSDNVAIGSASQFVNDTGNKNTSLGSNSLSSNLTGSSNTAVGYNANVLFGNQVNATAIGANAQVGCSNCLILGGTGTNAVKVGIGITSPTNSFSVSPVQYNTGTAGTNSISTTTISGSGTSWTSAMIGSEFVFADGTKRTITAVGGPTSLTVNSVVTEAGIANSYIIHYVGLQVTSSGNVGIGNSAPGTTRLVVDNQNTTNDILRVKDNGTDVLAIADGGLVTIQPAGNVNGSLNNIIQNLTVANTTASSTIRGYQQNITVNNTTNTATTTIGQELNVTDNATAIANINTGLKVTLAGSNTNQLQYGIDVSTTKGTALNATSTGAGGTSTTCGSTNTNWSLGLCATATGTGVIGNTTGNGTSLSSSGGTGVYGYNNATGAAGNFYAGIKGASIQSGGAAFTSIGVYGQVRGGNTSTIYGGYFELESGSGTVSAASSSLYASNTSIAANILMLQDNTTDVFKVADGGLLTLNPAANINGSLNHVTQNLTVANTTASSTIRGYQQNITVNNTTNTATTTIGQELNVTDSATAIANINTGLKVTLAGSNTSQAQFGVDATVAKGVGLRGESTGSSGTSITCGFSSGTLGVGVCGTATGTNGVGVAGTTSSDGTLGYNGVGTGVYGANNNTGGAGRVLIGIKGVAYQTASAAYSSYGVYGTSVAGAGATTYGGYFTLDSSSAATLGSALYASNSTVGANILQLQDNTTDVFKVADGGVLTLNPAANINGSLNHVTQNLTVANTTASSTIRGYQQNITVNNTTNTATTTIGQELNVTDNATAIANLNTALTVNLAGSNANQGQIGLEISANHGFGIRSTVTGASSGVVLTCGGAGGLGATVAVCAQDSSNSGFGIGVKAVSNSAGSSLIGQEGTAVYGLNNRTTASAGNFVFGVQGLATASNAAAYTGIGVYGKSDGGAGATAYGGYFTTGQSGASLGAALYATTPQPGAVATNGTNTIKVFEAAGGKGGNTSGTNHTAGVGSVALIQAGDGGNATSATGTSTAGTGGGITLQAGAGGVNSNSGRTNSNGGDVTIQGGAGGTGGTGGAYGNILMAASGGVVKVGGVTTPTLANVRLFVNIAEVATTIRIGDATNGVEFSGTSAPIYRGTARPTKRISDSPEFGGAVLRGDGSNNTGTMTTAFDATNFYNYYKWTTNQGSNQDFDVAVRVPVPQDYSALPASPSLCFYAYTSDTTNGTLTAAFTDSANATITLSNTSYTPGSTSTWTETCRTISGTPTITAGGYITIRMTMQSPASGDVRLGQFRMDYLSGF